MEPILRDSVLQSDSFGVKAEWNSLLTFGTRNEEVAWCVQNVNA